MIANESHMVKTSTKYGVSNNTAHNMLVKRKCLLGEMFSKQADLEVPTEFKVMSAYTMLSALVGSHSRVDASGEFSLNLWTLLVGPSGGRKSSAMIPYQSVIQSNSEFDYMVMPENTTTAALRTALEESVHSVSEIFGEDKPYARGVFFAQEFQNFFDFNKDPSAGSFYSDFWGGSPKVIIARRADGAFVFKYPTFTILGAIQTLRVLDILPLSTWRQGFYPRFITVYSDQEWPEPKVKGDDDWIEGTIHDPSSDNIKSKPYKDLLMEMSEELISLSFSSFNVKMTKDASKSFNNVKLPRVSIQLADYDRRRYDHFRKLCALTAISRAWRQTYNSERVQNGRVTITKEDVEITSALMIWNDSQLNKYVKDTIRGPNAEMYDRLDELIIENGGSIAKNKLVEFVRNEVAPDRMNVIINTLKVYYLDFDSKTKTYTPKKSDDNPLNV